VRNATTGEPIANAGVAVKGWKGSMVATRADGRFHWQGTGDRACSALRVTAAGYVATEVPLAARNESTRVELRSAAGQARQVELDIRGNGAEVGFGAEVTLSVELSPPDPDARVTWEQTEGPKVAVDDTTGPSLHFRTPTFESLGVDVTGQTPGGLVLLPAQTPVIAFRVTVSTRGRHAVTRAHVRTAYPQPEWPRALVGVDRYFGAGRVAAPEWKLAERPPRSSVELLAGDHATARLRPDVPGKYVIEESSSAERFEIRSGGYFGAKQCGRGACHPLQFAEWYGTKHATVMERGLRGELGDSYDETCWPCHALGAGGLALITRGFDAALIQAMEHEKLADSGELGPPPDAARGFSGVQCEHCHGPGRYWTGYSSNVCAICHDAPPRYDLMQAWRRSVADERILADDAPARTSGCSGCHSAQGFARTAATWGAVAAPAITDDPRSPHACLGCHDPHRGAGAGMLRVVAGPDAPAVTGPARVCVTCHRGIDATSVIWLDGFARAAAPHPGMIEEIILGRLGGEGPAPHADVTNLCVGCHMTEGAGKAAHSLRVLAEDGKPLAPQACAGADCHDDGVPEAPLLAGELRRARRAIDAAVSRRRYRGCKGERGTRIARSGDRIVVAGSRGAPLLDCSGRAVVLGSADRELYTLAYALLALEADPEIGVHNAALARDVVERSRGIR